GHRSFWVGFTCASFGALIGAPLTLADSLHFDELWVSYLALLDSFLGPLPRPGAGGLPTLLGFVIVALFYFPAQLLLALAGGLSVRAFRREKPPPTRRRRKR